MCVSDAVARLVAAAIKVCDTPSYKCGDGVVVVHRTG